MATSTLGSKKPSNISRTRIQPLNCPKYPLLRDILGNLRATFFAVLGHFCLLLRLGGCGSQGLYNRSKTYRITPQRSQMHELHIDELPICLGCYVCRTKLARKKKLSRREISREKCSEIFPEMFEPLFCGSEKIRKLPAKLPSPPPKNGGSFFLLTVGASLLTVKLLCLQSLKALIRRTFPL